MQASQEEDAAGSKRCRGEGGGEDKGCKQQKKRVGAEAAAGAGQVVQARQPEDAAGRKRSRDDGRGEDKGREQQKRRASNGQVVAKLA